MASNAAVDASTTPKPTTTVDDGQANDVGFSIGGETIQFGSNEKNILAFWKRIKAFETSHKLSKDRPR